MKLKKLIIIMAMGALALTACGSDDKGTSTSTSTSVSTNDSSAVSGSSAESSNPAEDNNTPAPVKEDVDLNAAADALASEGKFTAELSQLSAAAVPNFFAVEDGSESVVYMANNGSADSFGLFKCSDGEAAAATLENVKTYIAGVRDNAVLYTPDDVPKIDAAIVQVYDKYAVFCISDDAAKAKEIIERFFQ